MSVQQISVFLENKDGQLAEIAGILAEQNVNLRALSIADTQNFGILRMIADDPERVEGILREAGYICNLTAVLAVEVADAPGTLARVLHLLAEGAIGIEYTYAFTSARPGMAYMVFRVNDAPAAKRILASEGLHLADQSELF